MDNFELDIIDGLNALNYAGKCTQNDELTRALEGGIQSLEFRQLILWLTQELHALRKTDEVVSPDLNDISEFAMELSGLLKELGCPYEQFVAGPLSNRFEGKENCLNLLDYLITELMATKMALKRRPAENSSYIIPKFETNTAKALEQLSQDLQLDKPPENVTARAFFDKINFKVEERIRQTKPAILGEPLLKTQLSDEQWKKLEDIYMDLDAEYNLRRQVLLTRLDVTVQSFQWSEKMRDKEKDISQKFQQKMQDLEQLKYGGEETNIVALLAARNDLAIIEKTSSANVRKNTASKIQKHVIGRVPDRGGRAHEHAPPPPEMPSWQTQRASGSGGGHGGRGGGRGGGGGGNWNSGQPQQQRQQQQRYDQRPQYEQQSHYQQQHQQGGQANQNWISGSGRVQGSGWTTGASGDYNNQGRDGNNSQRGRSNYNRGGGGRGGYNRR